MSRFTVNCRWCADKPGGCLYCVNELEGSDQDKLLQIQKYIEAGDVHVLAIRNAGKRQEVLLRQVRHGGASFPASRINLPCLEHLWEFDAGNFQRRHCSRPGCSAREMFVWLPKSKDVNGEWVNENAHLTQTLSPARRGKIK